MVTGAGKTFTAVTESDRLLRLGGFKRILLVDRNNLADQTLRQFRDDTTPDDGRSRCSVSERSVRISRGCCWRA